MPVNHGERNRRSHVRLPWNQTLDQLRQVFNDTEAEVLWLIVGAGGSRVSAQRKDQARPVAHLPG